MGEVGEMSYGSGESYEGSEESSEEDNEDDVDTWPTTVEEPQKWLLVNKIYT